MATVESAGECGLTVADIDHIVSGSAQIRDHDLRHSRVVVNDQNPSHCLPDLDSRAHAAIGAVPNATLKRSHQITTDFMALRSASAGTA